MTTFAFLPRAVSKHTKEWQGISRPPSPPPDITDSEPDTDSKGEEKAHPKQHQDIASLITLALSDYNIWLDPDLHCKLDASLHDESSPDDAAFVPINYLLRRSPFRGSLPPDTSQQPSETEVVKALRAHASHTLEVRIRLPSSTQSSSVWYGTGKTSRKKDVGGYEVRRRDWPTLRDHPSRGCTRARWDDMTAYMECIPPQYRTVGGIARFAESLLSETDADADAEVGPHHRVQCVSLPPHYLDKPGDAPKCKGYALITFSTKSHLEAVLRAWPWQRRAPVPANDKHGNASPVMKDAYKYGLRVISKARWDALNEEYLVYKQSLVDEMARAETEIHRPDRGAPDHERSEPTARPHARPQAQAQTQMETQTTPSSPYPFDCLVFVRNVHPGTNKTTLKSLFTQAFQDQDGNGQAHGRAHTPTAVGLDYVDFNKGMDTCHIRLASPDHTTRLIDYFDARAVTQAHGLDATGRTPLEDDKSIAMERVRGKREVLYWDKIPEKVRRQAVDKAVKAQLASGAELSESASNTASGSGQKKRTRAF